MMKTIELVCNSKCLRGTVHIPQSKKGKFPMVIMFHGFAGNRIEGAGMFVKMSNILAENNIASIRFDFSGHGESDGDFIDVTVSNEIIEAKAIVDFVKNLGFVDSENIHLLGLSLGGVVASIVAGEYKNSIKSLSLWAPAAVILDDINIKKAIQGRSFSEEINTKGYFDMFSYKLSKRFIEDISDFTIFERAKKFDKKVMIIHGDADFIVPIKYSEQYIRHYGENGELHTISNADHGFATVEHRTELFKKTLEFIKDNN